MDLNELENIILTDIVKYQLKANNIDLRLQLQNLEVIKREYTGIGIYVPVSYTHLTLPTTPYV